MGIAKDAARMLRLEASRRPFGGRVLTLGRQDIYPSTAGQHISDDTFWRSLGFAESKVLDLFDESADYIFDLNSSEVPEHLLEAFDVIIDGGTLEHIFHIPNALSNICKMLRQGGRIIHLAPSSNHTDHGFYMFSPVLFWSFYKTNGFEINSIQMFRYTRDVTNPWKITDYQPDCLRPIVLGGLDNGMYGIACIVTKTQDSAGSIIPQQGEFKNK